MIRHLLTALIVCVAVGANAAGPNPKPGAKKDPVTVSLAVGFGYHLCGALKSLPPLETAYLCPGLSPGLVNVTLELKPVKTANSEDRMWSGAQSDSMEVDGTTMSYELLVSFAVVGKKQYVFIDGRVMNSTNPVPSYFRITSEGDFNSLNSTLNYGQPFDYKLKTGTISLMSPIVAVAKAMTK